MILGVLLLLATGLGRAFTGALLSYCVRRRIAVVTFNPSPRFFGKRRIA